MQFQEEKQSRKVDTLRHKEEEESIQLLSQTYKIPYLNLTLFPIEIDALKIIPEADARRALLVVFQEAGKHLKVAMRNPEKEETKALLTQLAAAHYTYDLFIISGSSLNHALGYYKKVPREQSTSIGSIQIAKDTFEKSKKELTSLAEIKARIEKTFFAKTTEALEIILAGAIAIDACDIHIEPQKGRVRLRFRLDGVLHDIVFIDPHLYGFLLSRLKLISELKLNIHDKAQDGRFEIETGGAAVEVRTSILPGPDGENTVLRILNPKAISVTFEGLGMQPWVSALVDDELKKPNGMILTTGPTGSGKTTSLYAFLKKIHTPEIKIITIEDPIEYHLEGIEQTQVDPEKGYDFASGLRSIVRQDPDVILVGEIRDLETAETAMHASLTGHLVFSTLHTNSAAGTIPRLLDIGVKPSIIAPAINVSMAQRLVRKLCKTCRTKAILSVKEKELLLKELEAFPRSVLIPDQKQMTIYKAAARNNTCADCSGIGYKGRIGVYEIILIDDEVERLISKDLTEFEIKKQAIRQGQITMRQDGILKIVTGITDFAELDRIVGTRS